jgi:hypothetical protein
MRTEPRGGEYDFIYYCEDTLFVLLVVINDTYTPRKILITLTLPRISLRASYCTVQSTRDYDAT